MNELQNKLVEEFEDTDYAHGYMEGHLHDKLTAQIYWTRKERGWTQAELARRAEMKQEQISKIESGEFTSMTMKTLRKIARALDVNLRLEFEPFSHAIHDVCQLRLDTMKVPDRAASLLEMSSSSTTIGRLYGAAPFFIPAQINTATTGSQLSYGTSVAPETRGQALTVAATT